MSIRSVLRSFLTGVFVVSALMLISSTLDLAKAERPPHSSIITCLGSIQACIDAAADGDTIVIPAGTYTESLTLSKPVSLTGVNSTTTIIHAVAGQRVLTVTGATISNSVVISGLTFTGGDATAGQGTGVFPTPTPAWGLPTPTPTPSAQQAPQQLPASRDHATASSSLLPAAWLTRHFPSEFDPARDGNGGGILITDTAQPQLQSMRVISNIGGYGGGIYIHDRNPLTLAHVDVLSNVAVIGGGILANSPVTLLQSILSNNVSLSTGGGAQISGMATVFDSHITHNEGGGLYVDGDLTAQHADISFNTPGVLMRGSGIIQSNGTLILDGAIIEGNSTSNWEGGGIIASGSVVWITNTHIMRNSAPSGGGGLMFYNGSSGKVINSLFTQNSATYGGTDIFMWGNMQLVHTIIADQGFNPGAAIFFATGALYITDTLITSHTVGIQRSPYATGVHEDYNLFYGNTTDRIGVTTGAHSLVGDPRFVDPLHDDYHLLPDSPAIDAGIDAGVYTDLDGHPRPIGSGFDIGAYESSYTAHADLEISKSIVPSLAAPGQSITYTLTFINHGSHIASGVLITDNMPTNLISLTVTNSGAAITPTADYTYAWQVADLAPNDSGLITISGVISASWFTSGVFTNTVLITATTIDTDTTNNEASASVLICGTIQCAIDAAHDGDTIVIPAGTYTESLTLSKPVSLTGVNSTTTIIHAVAGQRVLTVTGATISNSVVISGLTFTGGSADYGGGIALLNSAQPLIDQVRIANNQATFSGGGIYADQSSPLVLNHATVINNTAEQYRGGGLASWSWDPVTIMNSRFENNQCVNCDGGGLYTAGTETKTLTLSNTVFVNNVASAGGGLFVDNRSPLTLRNIQFISNTVDLDGGGLYTQGFLTLIDG